MFQAVSIVPLGQIRQDVVDAIAGGIYEHLHLDVVFEAKSALPSDLFDPVRGQFRAEDLVRYLRDQIPTSSPLRLGVTEADLYAMDMDYVFSISILKQGASIVSYRRLDNTFYSLPRNDRVLYERVVKEALHELGHGIGLEHCTQPCIMYFAHQSLMEIDTKPLRFCPECTRRLNLLLGRTS